MPATAEFWLRPQRGVALLPRDIYSDRQKFYASISMLHATLTIKVKVAITESFKVGWYPHKITGSSHLNLTGLWDWLTKQASRGFTLKKRLEDISYLFAYGVNDLSHLVVMIIFEMINIPMTVDASCRLFFSGSLQDSMLWRTLR